MSTEKWVWMGPLILLLVFGNAAPGEAQSDPLGGKTRTYYIAADEVEWDYAPSGMNLITGQPFGDAESNWAVRGKYRIGKTYKKAVYREYTDETFKTLKPRPSEWEHLGMLGPLLRAEVGDTIVVIFRNNASFPASVHPHGVFYDKDSEGAPYKDGTKQVNKSDDAVPQGGTHTYTWPVPERAGPAPGETSSILWMYHSHVQEVKDVNAGLMGPMIVSAQGKAKEDGAPKDVDREFVVSFHEVIENESWYIQENIETYMGDPDGVMMQMNVFGTPILVPKDGNGTPDLNMMESLNGFVYGNMPMMTMKKGEKVRWYLMSSTNFEMHTPHWHGNTVIAHNMRTDVTALLPMGMLVADMVPDNPGIWLFHCHVGNHFIAGMITRYEVMDR